MMEKWGNFKKKKKKESQWKTGNQTLLFGHMVHETQGCENHITTPHGSDTELCQVTVTCTSSLVTENAKPLTRAV